MYKLKPDTISKAWILKNWTHWIFVDSAVDTVFVGKDPSLNQDGLI